METVDEVKIEQTKYKKLIAKTMYIKAQVCYSQAHVAY